MVTEESAEPRPTDARGVPHPREPQSNHPSRRPRRPGDRRSALVVEVSELTPQPALHLKSL
jgi:hypothetical protein